MKNFPSIKKNSDFRIVYKKGKSKATECMVMYVFGNGTGCSRIGISAGRKFGNSVARHRFIRRIREIFRANINHTACGTDIVVVARKAASECGFEKLEQEYKRLLRMHGIHVKN